NVVAIGAPLGDVEPAKLRAIAEIARHYSGGGLRISIGQNFILRWVPSEALPRVFSDLRKLGLIETAVGQITDITRCPGADTCQLALTHSRALAVALQETIRNHYASVPEVSRVSIKMSGCMNSCGQHHIADIGLFGSTVESGGRVLPVYSMRLGGGTTDGQPTFGKLAAEIPARIAPEAVRHVLDYYLERRNPTEDFGQFFERIGIGRFRRLLEDFTNFEQYKNNEALQYDIGEMEAFTAEVGVGECAS